MHLSANKNILTVGDTDIELPCTIKEFERFEKMIVVITDYYESEINENVWGVDESGTVVWQIQKVDKVSFQGKEYSGISKPYTGIYKVSDNVARLFNWEGFHYEVNPRTGQFTKNVVEFRKGKRPW